MKDEKKENVVEELPVNANEKTEEGQTALFFRFDNDLRRRL